MDENEPLTYEKLLDIVRTGTEDMTLYIYLTQESDAVELDVKADTVRRMLLEPTRN